VQIVPADLNSYLYDMERNIADFALALNDTGNATRFSALVAQRHEAIQALMWDSSTGVRTVQQHCVGGCHHVNNSS
jgi:neutral trehalase